MIIIISLIARGLEEDYLGKLRTDSPILAKKVYVHRLL